MRIGLNLDNNNTKESTRISAAPANYSKAELFNVKDITDIGKDTSYIVDQGRSLQDVRDISGALDVDTQRDYMIVMSNILSKEDYAKAMEEGFDPSKMSHEEVVTIVDKIKAVMAQSGQIVAGYNDDLNKSALEEITGSAVSANELADAMKKADLPVNEGNAKSINNAAKELEEIKDLSEGAIKYLIENNLMPTIENIYKASFSNSGDGSNTSKGYYNLGMGGYLGKKGEDINLSSISADIEKLARNTDAGDLSQEEKIADVKWLISKGIEVNSDNILKYEELKNIEFPIDYEKAVEIASNSVAKGNDAKKADIVSDKTNIYEMAAKIYEKTNAISNENIQNVISNNKEMTLENLFAAGNTSVVSETELSFISAQRNLQEIRLRMSLEVNVKLLRSGFSIDTVSLSDVVDKLKQEEASLKNMFFNGDGAEGVDEKATIFTDTTSKVKELPYMPAALIGKIALREEYSLSTVYETGAELKAKYQAANESYEMLMTAPRKDLGDTIKQAFRNVDDILLDMGLLVGDENRKAVRILGYNSMEITTGNIDIVKEAMNKVTEAVKALTPGRVLSMIRQGINPMELNMEDLTRTLNSIDDDSNEKYSKFLYKLEKSNSVTESEKEAFLGIYRLVNRLEKTDSAAIGGLIQGNRDITLSSLLSQIRSNRVNMNISVDDNFGFLTETVEKGKSISAQIEQAFINKVGISANDMLEQAYISEKYTEFMKDSVNETDIVKTEVYSLTKKYEKRISDNNDIEIKVNNFIEKFENAEAAKTAYSEVMDEMQSVLNNMTEYVASSMEDFRAIALCNKQISTFRAFSDEENYVVPMEVSGEEVTVNLVIRHSETDKGQINTRLYTEAYGEITANLSLTNEKVSGLITCENREGLELLNQVASKVSAHYEESDINIAVGKQNLKALNGNVSEKNDDNNNVDTKMLYMLAKRFITAFNFG